MPAQQRVLTADEKRQAAETAFMRVDVNGNGQADCLEFYQALMILRPDLACTSTRRHPALNPIRRLSAGGAWPPRAAHTCVPPATCHHTSAAPTQRELERLPPHRLTHPALPPCPFVLCGPDDDAMVVFSIIDANGNGNVSKQEFVDHYMANY